MARTTGATGRTVARRRAVSLRGMFFSGSRGANFAFASVITTVVCARARRFFRISRSVTGATISRTARRAACDAVALSSAVFVNAGTRTRRLALLTLACTGATVVCARAIFVVRILRIVGFVAGTFISRTAGSVA